MTLTESEHEQVFTNHANDPWLEVVVTPPNGQKRDYVVRIGAFIQRLRDHGEVRRWHYFLDEPWGVITVRADWWPKQIVAQPYRGDRLLDSTAFIILPEPAFLEHAKASFGLSAEYIHSGYYIPEIQHYGEAWDAVARLLEATSDIGILMASNLQESNLRPRKLIHCTFNQWGFDWPGEVAFHDRAMKARQFLIILDKLGWLNAWLAAPPKMPLDPVEAIRWRDAEDSGT